jgi:hypothetical protein
LVSLAYSAALTLEARADAAHAKELTAQVTSQSEQLAGTNALLESLRVTLRAHESREHETTRNLLRESDALTSQLTVAEQRREAATTSHRRLEHLTTALEEDLRSLRESHQATRRRLHEKELLLAMCENPSPLFSRQLPGPPVPAVDGYVVSVSSETPGPIVLSVGSDDMVEVGYRFSVYRGSQFVAKVVVERLFLKRADCRLLFAADGQAIRRGDAVATRLQ